MSVTTKKVGIIGAGIAGLCTAKTFKRFGYQVTVFEKEADVGGVWSASRRYPGLTTQNPRDTYEYSDFPMPSDYPEWPSGEQVQKYLKSYVEHFALTDDIHLNTDVVSADWDEAAGHWNVATKQGQHAGHEVFSFDYLTVCNGIFSIPSIPEYPGAARFIEAGGTVCHTSEFTQLEEARGKNVLVVGYGKSSCDVANATVGISASTTVVARHLIWKIPKKLKNILNFKFLFLTRLGEGLFRYIRLQGFEKFLHGPGKPIRNALLNSVESVVAKQLRLRKIGLHPEKPLETIARSTVSLVTDGYYENLINGRLRMKARVEITELLAGEATLSTGETVPADIVICGTGWHQRVPFFNDELTSKLTDSQGNFRLYRTMVPVDVPRLMFNGYNSSFFSQLNAEVGALWLIELMTNHITLPHPDVMNQSIDERLAWTEARTDGKHSKGTNIIPFSVHQMDELLNEIDLNIGLLKRFTQWLMPVVGPDYKTLMTRLLARHNAPDLAEESFSVSRHATKSSR